MPHAADEVALGPATVEAAGAHIGGEVTLSGEVGSARYRVVGAVLFPEGDFSHDEGAALTVEGGERAGGPARGWCRLHPPGPCSTGPMASTPRRPIASWRPMGSSS